VDYSTNIDSDDSVQSICSMNGYYFIEVRNYADIIRSEIHLTVSGATGSGCTLTHVIPSFELIAIIIGIISAVFLAVHFMKKPLIPHP